MHYSMTSSKNGRLYLRVEETNLFMEVPLAFCAQASCRGDTTVGKTLVSTG